MNAKELILGKLRERSIEAIDINKVKIYSDIDRTTEIKFVGKDGLNHTTITKYCDIRFSDEELDLIKSEGLLTDMRKK